MKINEIEQFIDESVASVWSLIKQDIDERNEGGKEWADKEGLPDWEGMAPKELADDIGDHLYSECIDRMEHRDA